MRLRFIARISLLGIWVTSVGAQGQTPAGALWGGLQPEMDPKAAATTLSKIDGVASARVKDDGVLVKYTDKEGVPLFGIDTTVNINFRDNRIWNVMLTTKRECVNNLQGRVGSFGSALAAKYGNPPTSDGSKVVYSNADATVELEKLDMGIPQLPDAPVAPETDNPILKQMYDFEVLEWKAKARDVTNLVTLCSSSGGRVGDIQITYTPTSSLVRTQSDEKVSAVQSEKVMKAAAEAAQKRAADASKM